jgi:hypothetical protein
LRRRSANAASRFCSTWLSTLGLGNKPICISSDLVCATIPGLVCVAPTHVCGS